MGVNINNKIPKNLENIAISLKQINGKVNNVSKITSEITRNFKKYYTKISNSKMLIKYKKNVKQ